MKEFILCAAIDFKGTIICGHRHSDCYELLLNLVNPKDEDVPGRDFQGFLTSKNRFVNRKEAYKIAEENNQIKFGHGAINEEDKILISENLY